MPIVVQQGADGMFFDQRGHLYSGCFDGRNVFFSSRDADSVDFIGQWMQGTPATMVRGGRQVSSRFLFTFMDHGEPPQRLHALWEFDGPLDDAIESWKLANFSISVGDRHFNRKHPASSIHLRTRGARVTGADSSHVVIPLDQTGKHTTGNIHVGEFNPMTGCGIGFVLHLLEGKFR